MDIVRNRNEEPVKVLKSDCHESHISRHVNEMIAMHKQEGALRVLDDCGLQRLDGIISKRDGSPVTFSDCRNYMKAVRRIIGYVDYLVARISLAQAGCSGLYYWRIANNRI